MPNVVSNTTPILSFIKLGRLDILKNVYGEITIPEGVYLELEEGKTKGKCFYVDLSKEPWIKIVNISQDKTLKRLITYLDRGEAEAIALSLKLRAELLLIDERFGRKVAEEMGIKYSGTIGVLFKAKNQGLINEIKPFLYSLIECGNYYNKSFIKTVLKIAGETE